MLAVVGPHETSVSSPRLSERLGIDHVPVEFRTMTSPLAAYGEKERLIPTATHAPLLSHSTSFR